MEEQIRQNSFFRAITNHRLKYLYGWPMGEVVEFDTEYSRRRGPQKAQVFRNHRTLRNAGRIINGIYQKVDKYGPKDAA